MQLASMIDCSQNFKCFCVKISPAPQDLGSGEPFQILVCEKIFASEGVELSISEIDGGTHEGARAAIKWCERTKQNANICVLCRVCAVPKAECWAKSEQCKG